MSRSPSPGKVLLPDSPRDVRRLARLISRIEDGHPDVLAALAAAPTLPPVPVVGLTGPPGAGKSSLVDRLVAHLTDSGHHVAVVAVDPSSPFSGGALLGDRIRMQRHAVNPRVFIRSLATRGHMGGLTLHTWEVVALLRHARFDYILLETVGVGQSEVDVMGVADATVVVLVPEGGDEIQHIKAGLMEIADVLVVNKADRPGADDFIRRLQQVVRPRNIPVIATQATRNQGVERLWETVSALIHRRSAQPADIFRKARQAYQLIASYRMRDVSVHALARHLQSLPGWDQPDFNLLFALHPFLGGSADQISISSTLPSDSAPRPSTNPSRL